MKNKFKNYSEKHIHFIEIFDEPMLEKLISKFNEDFSLIDIGCGDGRNIYSLYKKSLLKKAKNIIGVDISEERIKRFEKINPFSKGLVGDVCNLNLGHNIFDVVISTQVIEHVTDEDKMLKNVWYILKPQGYLYISSVIKKWYGLWIYWNKGFKLDPTHLREYKSVKEFLKVLEKNGFEIIEWEVRKIRYSIIDLILRFLIKINIIKPETDLYYRYPLLLKLRKITIRVLGYYNISVVARAIK
jgi:2-polyprenyl-3-methyl-5-hydroxy-6-metoxy-1,4-benzoquinol methylase